MYPVSYGLRQPPVTGCIVIIATVALIFKSRKQLLLVKLNYIAASVDGVDFYLEVILGEERST